MARRDFEKILKELAEIRGTLDDPATGLAAFHQDQEELRRKVLETVSLGTTGLREENRELRRRQEKMLSDLGETRTAVEALRREIAQAWVHTIGLPGPAAAADGVTATAIDVPQGAPHVLEAGTSSNGNSGGKAEAVHEERHPDPTGHQDGPPGAEPESASGVPAQQNQTPASSAVPALPGEPSAGHTDAPPTKEQQTAGEKEQRTHREGLVAAAGVASARLVCHRDTWAFLIEQTSQHRHFRLPDRINDLDEGQIEAFLSGRSLLAVLVTLRTILDDTDGDRDMVTWALADAVYQRTQQAVTAATPGGPGAGGEVTTIVLDNRPTPSEAQ
jgi:hypothetical protein